MTTTGVDYMQIMTELREHGDLQSQYTHRQPFEWETWGEHAENSMVDGSGSIAQGQKLSVELGETEYDMRFTRNLDLIAQYKLLRHELYKIDPRFVGFRFFNEISAEDYEDPDHQMLILYNGNRCYGGACLRISTPKHPVVLDLENDILPTSGKYYFSLRERFPEMELDKYAYAEFNRIVLHPSLRKGEATRRIFQAVLDRCVQNRVRYMFGIGDRVRVRLYRQIYHNAGMECRVRDDVDIPMRTEYEGMKMQLLWGDMKKFHATPADPDAGCLLNPISDFSFID